MSHQRTLPSSLLIDSRDQTSYRLQTYVHTVATLWCKGSLFLAVIDIVRSRYGERMAYVEGSRLT